jgi:ERCC4-type nuclease
MKILLDTRESSETKEILGLFLKSEEMMLPVGDILVDDSVCFEHKTPSDLITSVFDGRLFTQISAMQNNYPHSFVLVSGTLTEVLEIAETVDRYSSILAAVCSCYVRNCPIIFCCNLTNLAEIVKVLGEKLTDGKERSRPVEKTKMEDKRLQLICAFKGIDATRGKALLEEFGTVWEVLNASSSSLQEVHGIGKVTTDNMRAVLDS